LIPRAASVIYNHLVAERTIAAIIIIIVVDFAALATDTR
jgi:hypothetical protein